MLVPHPDRTTPEGILSFGAYGSGKTEDWACIADAYRKYGNDGHFWVLSTEYERVLASMEGRAGWRDNIHIFEVHDFDSLMGQSEVIQAKVSEKIGMTTPIDSDEWIVVDTVGPCQRWARDLYFAQSRGMTYREFQEKGGTSDEVQAPEWQQMESIYLSWFNPYVMRFPGHRFVTAQVDGIGEGKWAPKANSTVGRVFSRLGMKPVGYKDLGAQLHTVLYKQNPSVGDYEISTVKDKPGREMLSHQKVMPPEFGGFVMTYLIGNAGWVVTD